MADQERQGFTHRSVTMFLGIVALYLRQSTTKSARQGMQSNASLLQGFGGLLEKLKNESPEIRALTPEQMDDFVQLGVMFCAVWESPEFQFLDPGDGHSH